MTPKTLAQNNKQISLTIKAENFVYQKTLSEDITKKVKRQPKEWEIICSSSYTW